MTRTTPHPTTTENIPALRHVGDKTGPGRNYKSRPTFWHTPETTNVLQSIPHMGLAEIDGVTLRDAINYISRWCHSNTSPDGKPYTEAILYLAGGHDAASTQPADYYREPLQDGWRIDAWRTGPMAVSYEALGLTVAVRVAASWFDETDADLVTMAEAYGTLALLLKAEFGQKAHLLGTPAQTGHDLIEMSLPFGLELPVLPTELRQLIQHNSPQGRNEVLSASDGINAGIDTLEALTCYDAKWMYAACLNHVPAGRWEYHYNAGSYPFDEWAVGFYRFAARVPRDWPHIGLLPMWDADEKRTVYPWQPGTTFDGWATGAEIQLALKQGWNVNVLQSLVWPQAQKLNPLRNWRDKLIPTRGWVEQRGTPAAALNAVALRHIVIDALGGMARREQPVHHITPYDQMKSIPHEAYNRSLERWGIEWDIDTPLSGWSARFAHPEIPAMVWGRARARLAKFALDLPVEASILFRTDAVWVHGSVVGIDTSANKPGEWREKESLEGPLAAPRSTAEGLQLIRAARGKVVL